MKFAFVVVSLWIHILRLSAFDVIEAEQFNQKESTKVYYSLPVDCKQDYEAERWTGYTAEPQLRCISKGIGSMKVLLIGNSYAYRTFPVLHELFKSNYSEFRFFSRSSKMFLNENPEDLDNYAELAKNLIINSKPDIIFVIEKDMKAAQNNIISGPIKDDPIFKFTQDRVNFLMEHSSKVIIDDQYYKPDFGPKGVAQIIIERLQRGETSIDNFQDLKIDRKLYIDHCKFGQMRFSALKGDKLIKNRVGNQMCEADFCYFFNQNNLHAYYGDSAVHQTSEMIERLKPGYAKIIEDIFNPLPPSSDTSIASVPVTVTLAPINNPPKRDDSSPASTVSIFLSLYLLMILP